MPTGTNAPVGGALRLAAFDSCDGLLADFRSAALRGVEESQGKQFRDGRFLEPPSMSAPRGAAQDAAEAPSSEGAALSDHSTTNTQERGVDEPDVVKTDGRRVLTVANGTLNVVDVATRRVTGSLALPDMQATDLLVSGDRVLLITSTRGVMPDGPRTARDSMSASTAAGGRARFVLVDVSGAPRVLGDMAVDGDYVDARQVGATTRIVVRSSANGPRTWTGSAKETRDAIRRSTLTDWLPGYTLTAAGRTDRGNLVDCERVSRPASAPGDPGHSGTATLSVLSFDLGGELGRGDPVTVAADVEHVYATASDLYLSSTSWSSSGPKRSAPGASPTSTVINRFDISGTGTPRLVAGGEVPGTLLNQYAMSEHEGNLRVATTLDSVPDGTGGDARSAPSGMSSSTESAVTVLARDGSNLVPIGRVGGLGRNERIYAVRYSGPIAYVVTFRQTDPLYTLDLSDPRAPKAIGELKINGYSAYLHPIANGGLIGVGQDATDGGMRLGTQVSLFDVANLANPTRVAQYQVPGANSAAEFDPHAFLYWDRDGTLVIPIQGDGSTSDLAVPSPEFAPGEIAPQTGYALVLRVSGGSITEVGRITHTGASIVRSMVIGSELWTVSRSGLAVNALTDARRTAWIPLGVAG